MIEDAHRYAAAEAPFHAPQLIPDAALWSFSVVAWSVSLFVDRSDGNTQLPNKLLETQPKMRTVEEQWSVDLGFRFLYSLLVRCERVSPNDTLVTQIVDICRTWPLACVGRPIEIDESALAITLSDPCLRTILVDRIVTRRDLKLAEHPLVKRFVELAVGLEPDFQKWS